MLRHVVAVGLVCLSVVTARASRADQYDVILRFADQATAIADAQAGQYYDQAAALWRQDAVVPVQVWRNSQDTTDGQGNVVHNYMTGYFVLVSLPRLVPALRDIAAVQLVVDRDKCNARQAGCVVKSNVTNAVLQDIRLSPVFMGTDYPWGGFN